MATDDDDADDDDDDDDFVRDSVGPSLLIAGPWEEALQASFTTQVRHEESAL